MCNGPIASHPHALGLGNGLSVVCAVVSGLGGEGTVYIQASHSRAPLAVGVVRSEPVIPDRVSLSHHVPVSRFYIAPKPSSSPRRLSLPLLLPPAQQRKKSNRHALRS